MKTNLGPGLSNLEWTLRMEPCFADTLTSAWWWWPPAGLIQVAVKDKRLVGKAWFRKEDAGQDAPFRGAFGEGTCITLDLQDVEFAIDRDPKAHAFFLDLACWLLTKCAAASREGADA